MSASDKALQVLIDLKLIGEDKVEEARKALSNMGSATTSLTGHTNKLAEATKEGNEKGVEFEGTHRALERTLRVIAGQTGPAAGAALSSVAAIGMGGGGLMLAAEALGQVFEAIHQDAEEVRKKAQEAREAFVTMGEQAEEAGKHIGELRAEYSRWNADLDAKAAESASKSSVALQIQQFKDLADAAAKAGLMTKTQANDWEQSQTTTFKNQRATALESDAADLKAQLATLQSRLTGTQATTDAEHLAALQEEKKKAEEAYKTGHSYRLKNIAGEGVDAFFPQADGTVTPDDTAQFKRDIAALDAAIKAAMPDKAAADHAKLLETTIERMSTEAQALRADVAKNQQPGAANDFAGGLDIGRKVLSGQPTSASDQQFLVVLEQSITGHKLTVEQAAQLVQMQSAQQETMLLLLQRHAADIAQVQARLDALGKHGQ